MVPAWLGLRRAIFLRKRGPVAISAETESWTRCDSTASTFELHSSWSSGRSATTARANLQGADSGSVIGTRSGAGCLTGRCSYNACAGSSSGS